MAGFAILRANLPAINYLGPKTGHLSNRERVLDLMVKTHKSIASAFKSIDKAIKSSTRSALNKALSETAKKVKSDLRKEVGLPKERVDKRVALIKASAKKPTGAVSIGTKFDVNLGDFKPQIKAVKTVPTNASRARKYLGVSVKIGKQPRQLVPGAFVRQVRSGKEVVIGHRDTLDAKGKYNRGPTRRSSKWSITPKSDIIRKAAQGMQRSASQYLTKLLDSIFSEHLAETLRKKLDK